MQNFRTVENITAMLLGIHLFEQFAEACAYRALPEDLGAKPAVEAVLADVLETDHGVKNALDHFVEMLGVMAIQGELRAAGPTTSSRTVSSTSTWRAATTRSGSTAGGSTTRASWST